ncbi:ABC-2 transporter permease [Acetobacterium wieringae]|uniref:ABC-2 transporter permease n=1 Tax=Acetobacterium wieringae TaxID=52694 RepID=UPI002B2131C2|nr:ABC-2 transporter permease [Acetobacterium wieringae]MEA4805883.1 ABC-2 transporter permease [Acetobacterium wieringae]
MKGLILKDLLNLKSSFKMLGVMILFFAVAFLSQRNGVVFGIIIMMFAMMVVTTISCDDLAKWDAYALTMPVTRKEIVLSKYLVMALLNTLGAVLSVIVGIVGSFFIKQSFDQEILVIVGLVYLIAFIFGSLIIPLIYKFGTEKARLMLFLCALLPTALILLLEQFNVPMPTTGNPWIYLFLLIGLSVAGVILSYLISLKIYTKKEF